MMYEYKEKVAVCSEVRNKTQRKACRIFEC
jgi:hypothetical protein